MKSFLPFAPQSDINLAANCTSYSFGDQYLHTFEVENLADRLLSVCICYQMNNDLEVAIKITASICNPEDQFRSSLGEEIALGRALKANEWDQVIAVNEAQDVISAVRAATEHILVSKLNTLECLLSERDARRKADMEELESYENRVGEEISGVCK